jgi:poly(beta-D-mannuronate) lyase
MYCSRRAAVALVGMAVTPSRWILAALLALGCSERADQGGAGSDAPSAGTGQGGGASGSRGGSSAPAGVAGRAGVGGSMKDAGTSSEADASAADAQATPFADAHTDLQYPADLLDLSTWKLTLPTGEEGSPTEILQPELDAFELEPYFHLDAARDGVVFRAHAGGVTTGNSSYPRCELREMAGDGSEMAAWSTTEGVHAMTIAQQITHLPEVKPHVVAGQVHDAEDDVVMIRLEGQNLFVEGGGEDLGTLDAAYAPGTRFTVKIEAAGGRIRVYYEDLVTPAVDIERDTEGCYFKAGAYTQSNPERGDDPDAYGEVVIHDLSVTHDP